MRSTKRFTLLICSFLIGIGSLMILDGAASASANSTLTLHTGFQNITLIGPATPLSSPEDGGPVFPTTSTVTITFKYGTQVVGTKSYTHTTQSNFNMIINDWVPANYKFDLNNISNDTDTSQLWVEGSDVRIWTSVFDQHMTINVLPVAPQETTITVQYMDENNQPLSGVVSKSISQTVGSQYNVSGSIYKPSIPGYTLDLTKLPGNAAGIVGSDPITVTYVYKKNPEVAKPVTVKYVDENSQQIAADKTVNGNVFDHYNVSVPPYKLDEITKDNQIYMLDPDRLPTNVAGTLSANSITVTYVYKRVRTIGDYSNVIINYLDKATQKPIRPSRTITGIINDPYAANGKYQLQTIVYNGNTYDLSTDMLPQNASGHFTGKTQFVNYFYSVRQTPTPPTPPTPINPIIPTPTPKPAANNGNVAKKGTVVYAIKPIYLYKNSTFVSRQRLVKYLNKPRIYRPMFVVTGYARSTDGLLRYHVRDVNHLSKTDTKTGYITANNRYVRPVYYAGQHKFITVLNPRGVNAYRQNNLTGKFNHFKQGTQLKVSGIIKHNLTTRFILLNGKYITANRKLVIEDRHSLVKAVKAKVRINRYNNVNLGAKNGHFKKGAIIKVHQFNYSWGDDFNKRSALRYRVAGGYITGNTQFIKLIK